MSDSKNTCIINSMRILITGIPRVGKSTIIQNIIKNINAPINGIITKELRNDSGKRIGFESCNLNSQCKLLAHVSDINSKYTIANKYHVDIDVIDNFICNEISNSNNNKILIIDEIGRMQAISQKFLKIIESSFQKNNTIIATIVYDPEPWSMELKNKKDILKIIVTKENREWISEAILIIIKLDNQLKKISYKQKIFTFKLLEDYFSQNKKIQVFKLVNNALKYIINDMVTIKEENIFKVIGNTKIHNVIYGKTRVAQCDCDLWNGKGDYLKSEGICSHIQAVELFKLK